ncbi:UPF0235 protein C15orf40 homolog [Lineus longissimus]|uniref:UPF0235 protein C15orf40 homolog n=1 Tax=Lineus longissimus TaxID=88925 RepID=UPI002B4F6D4A
MLKRCYLGVRTVVWNEQCLFHISNKLEMPKKQNNASKQSPKPPAQESQQDYPVSTKKDGSIEIKILAKPGARQNSITDISEDGVGVQIAAPPVDGEANTELIRYISKVLGLRKSDVTLDRGSKSRNKTIVVSSSSSTVEQVMMNLQKELEAMS